MRTFILRSLLFFILAAVVTVAVFFVVSTNSISSSTVAGLVDVMEEKKTNAVDTAKQTEAIEKITATIPEEGVSLAELSIPKAEKETLEKVGVDVDTFTVTKTMVACGAEKIGTERIEAIMGGESPTVVEVTKLIPCLKEGS